VLWLWGLVQKVQQVSCCSTATEGSKLLLLLMLLVWVAVLMLMLRLLFLR
jgi:hypothetical protein